MSSSISDVSSSSPPSPMHKPLSTATLCVYDVPLALDSTTNECTVAFDHRGAAARNKRNVQDSRQWTAGPMPVQQFLKYFLRLDDHSSHERMSSRDAFRSVPPRADSAAGIYEPLVRDRLVQLVIATNLTWDLRLQHSRRRDLPRADVLDLSSTMHRHAHRTRINWDI